MNASYYAHSGHRSVYHRPVDGGVGHVRTTNPRNRGCQKDRIPIHTEIDVRRTNGQHASVFEDAEHVRRVASDDRRTRFDCTLNIVVRNHVIHHSVPVMSTMDIVQSVAIARVDVAYRSRTYAIVAR